MKKILYFHSFGFKLTILFIINSKNSVFIHIHTYGYNAIHDGTPSKEKLQLGITLKYKP